MHRACLGGSPTWHFHILRMLHPSGTVNRDSPLNFGSWVFIRFSLYRCDWMNHWPCDWSQPLPQYMHVHALTHTHTYICVHTILMHAHTYLCMHTRLSTHTYSHLHICSHSCEHIHSHIHTCSFLSDCLLSELGNQIGSDRETCL